MELQKELCKILACPLCHGPLQMVEEASSTVGLRCDACALVYPVRNNIPVMLAEEAIAVDHWQGGLRQAKV